MKNADVIKKTRKYSSGHILENKGSIRYHCKMAPLDLYFPKKQNHRDLPPSPIKTTSKSATPSHKKITEPQKPQYDLTSGFKVLIFAGTKFCRYLISPFTHPKNVF